MTDVVALQNTHCSYMSAALLRESEMLEATGWIERGIQLSSEFLKKKRRLGGPEALRCLPRYLASMSLLKLGYTALYYIPIV